MTMLFQKTGIFRPRLQNILIMKKPEDLGDTQWKAVLGRCRELHQRMEQQKVIEGKQWKYPGLSLLAQFESCILKIIYIRN